MNLAVTLLGDSEARDAYFKSPARSKEKVSPRMVDRINANIQEILSSERAPLAVRIYVEDQAKRLEDMRGTEAGQFQITLESLARTLQIELPR